MCHLKKTPAKKKILKKKITHEQYSQKVDADRTRWVYEWEDWTREDKKEKKNLIVLVSQLDSCVHSFPSHRINPLMQVVKD